MRYSGLILATILYFLLYLAFLNYYESFFSFLYIPVPDRGIVTQVSTLSFVIFWILVLFPLFLIMENPEYEILGTSYFVLLGLLLFIILLALPQTYTYYVAKIIVTLFSGLAVINGALAAKLSEIHSHIEYYLRSRKEKRGKNKTAWKIKFSD